MSKILLLIYSHPFPIVLIGVVLAMTLTVWGFGERARRYRALVRVRAHR